MDKKYILNFFKENPLGVLSTVDIDNLPDAAPIYYVIDEDFTIYFICPVETKKFINITNKNNITLTITQQETNQTIQVKGTTTVDRSLLPDILERISVVLNSKNKFITTLPLLKHKDQKKTVVIIKPKTIRYRNYQEEKLDEEVFNFDN